MNVVILWHMHQPYYVNPLTKKAMMPWVRLHAAKGYLDMIDLVTAQPDLRVNFNFSPVLVRQILELVNNEVQDDWENLSRKPAANLDEQERRQLLENFFKIHWDTLVRPVPAMPNCWRSGVPVTRSASSMQLSAPSPRPTCGISRLFIISSGAAFPLSAGFPS